VLRAEAVRERVAVPLRLAAARLGAAVVFLAAPSVSSAFLRVRVPVPVEPLLAEAERPVPLAFSLAPEARWLVLRLAVLLVPAFVDVLFAPPSDEEEEGEPLPPSTFCAASATASAISEPKRLTLAAIELAALVALSAASAPASRILRRTDGLALIVLRSAIWVGVRTVRRRTTRACTGGGGPEGIFLAGEAAAAALIVRLRGLGPGHEMISPLDMLPTRRCRAATVPTRVGPHMC
jgi:hypothetical protein